MSRRPHYLAVPRLFDTTKYVEHDTSTKALKNEHSSTHQHSSTRARARAREYSSTSMNTQARARALQHEHEVARQSVRAVSRTACTQARAARALEHSPTLDHSTTSTKTRALEHGHEHSSKHEHDVAGQSLRAVSRTAYAKPIEHFLTMWVCIRLDDSKCLECLHVVTCHFS